jgi:hypothetical protein
MPLSRTITFKQVPARRPAVADVLAGTKTSATPTVPVNMLAPEEFEQIAQLAVACARMVPVLRVSVAGGTSPAITAFACIRDDISSSDINVTRNATGDVSVTWPAGTFPASNSQPVVGSNVAGGSIRWITAVPITNGVRVYTVDEAESASDGNFTVEVF